MEVAARGCEDGQKTIVTRLPSHCHRGLGCYGSKLIQSCDLSSRLPELWSKRVGSIMGGGRMGVTKREDILSAEQTDVLSDSAS